MSSAASVNERAKEIFAQQLQQLHGRTDRLFALLFVLQWLAAIVAALVISPRTWSGGESYWHVHLWTAILLGGTLTSAPVLLAFTAPGALRTRLTVAVAQAGYSALLIHLTGGRIETHFHVFGSLAFLAFYRDWRVLIPATLVVSADHLLRGVFWPESVFGALTPSAWRALEHAGWVLFEDVFLAWSCVASCREMRQSSATQAELEQSAAATESTVQQRTAELRIRTRELERSVEESNRMSIRLSQAQKLESIGQLAAGVAHEINTPMQFIRDNSLYLRDCLERLLQISKSYAEMSDPEGPGISWQERHRIAREVLQQCRHEELQREVPAAIEESLDGIERVVTIVRAMKEFSHPGSVHKSPTDVNQLLRSTATVTRNRWKYVARIDMQLDDDLSAVPALPGELSQVVLNLVVNAADAIRERFGDHSSDLGLITIRTFDRDEFAVIEIQDNGTGIPAAVRDRVFDPFFTTKEVGMGTGQGLAISHDIVVKKHGGNIDIDSQEGIGTTFSLQLPLRAEAGEPGNNEELETCMPATV